MPKNFNYRLELSSTDSNFPARVVLFDKPGNACSGDRHWHKTIEINYVLRGTLVIETEEDKYILAPNEFSIINSNEVHKVSGRSEDTPVRFLNLSFSHSFVKHYYPQYVNYIYQTNTQEQQEYIRRLLKEISISLIKGDDLSELHVLTALLNILDYMFSKCSSERVKLPEHREEQSYDYAGMAIDYMLEHYSEKLSLDQAAAKVGLTPTYFSKLFKKKTSKTFLIYLNDIRLDHALRDIANYNMTETEAALSNGFANVKAFILTFKRNFSCTPSQYMAQHYSLPDKNNYTR